MKPRSIKELLKVLLNNQWHYKTGACHGMCGWCFYLELEKIISDVELVDLLNYIRANPPETMFDKDYFFEIGKLEPRIKWIKEHIKLNS